MMTDGPFEQHFQQWLHGVQWEARVQREEQNLNTLVRTLQERGHVVKVELPDCIQVNPNTPLHLTITARNAREMEPAKLLAWVEERQRLFAREMEARQAREEEQEACHLAEQTAMTQQEALHFLWILARWQARDRLSAEQVAQFKQAALDAAHQTGESPVTLIHALYQAWEAYKT